MNTEIFVRVDPDKSVAVEWITERKHLVRTAGKERNEVTFIEIRKHVPGQAPGAN